MQEKGTVLPKKASSRNRWQEGMGKLLWAVKTPYKALYKDIGEGCSLWDTPIFCAAEGRLIVSVKLIDK